MDNELSLSDVSRGLNLWYDIQAVRTRYLGPKHEDPRQVMDLHVSGWYLAMMAVTLNVFCTVWYIDSRQLLPELTTWLAWHRLEGDGVMDALLFIALVNGFIAVLCGAINSSGYSEQIDANRVFEDYTTAMYMLLSCNRRRAPPRYPKGKQDLSTVFSPPPRIVMDLAGMTTADVIKELNRTYDCGLDPDDFVFNGFDNDPIFPGTVFPVVIVAARDSARFEGAMMVSVQIPHTGAAGMMPRIDSGVRKRYIAMLTGGSYSPRPSSDCSGFNPHIVTPSQVAIPGKTRMTMEIVETPMGMYDNGRTEITCVRKELLC